MSEPTRLTRPTRQLTLFMGEELLCEYIAQRLDTERARAVEKALQSQPDLRRSLKVIEGAELYCTKIAKTRISALQIESLKSTHSLSFLLAKRLRYRNWPDVIQWTIQAFVLSSLVAVAALTIPWGRLEQHVRSKKAVKAAIVSSATVKSPTVTSPTVTSPTVSLPTVTPATSSSAPTSSAAPKPSTPKSNGSQVAKSSAVVAAAAPKYKGVLYRMWMGFSDADTVDATIKQKIIALGGHKAGEVPLGWHRPNPTGVYFHFVLPKKNYAAIVQALKALGPVNIAKTANPRVMPPNEVRIILWVQELTPKKQTDEQQNKTTQ